MTPFHANCRTTTIPYFDDEFNEGEMRAARGEDGKTYDVPADMTYSEWKKLNGVAEPAKSGTIKAQRNITNRSISNGMRRSPLHVLTNSEIESVTLDAKTLGISVDVLRFNEGSQTGFSDSSGVIFIRGDVLPDLSSNHPRDSLTQRAVLVHEFYGHYAHHPSTFRVGDWRDEFRASYSAAIPAPNLSSEERKALMLDAYDRAREAGVTVKYNKKARLILYGKDE